MYNLSAVERIMSGRRLSPVIIQGDRQPGRSTYNFYEFTDWKVWARRRKAELCLQVKRPWSRCVLQPATMWSSDSEWRQKEQPEVFERIQRFFLVASVLLRYLIVKLKILAGNLLWARDQSELRFFKEWARTNEIMNPCDGNPVWSLFVCSIWIDFRTCFVFLYMSYWMLDPQFVFLHTLTMANY